MQGKFARAAASAIAAGLTAAAGLGSARVAAAAAAVADVPCSATALASDMNSARSGETLSLAAGCRYRLTAGLPVVSQDLVIAGNGATLERSLAPGTPAFIILQVNSGTVTVSGLNFRNGRGAIVVSGIGDVRVSGGTFTGNMAGTGGAIDDNSALDGLTVNGATFIGNTAMDGGAIFDFSAGGATVTDSVFSGNHAVYGGAIFTDPNNPTSLSGVVLQGNSAMSGGGIDNATSVTLTNSHISGNSASRQGGGLYNAGGQPGDAKVTGTIFHGNSARDGAGIYNADGIVIFTHDAIAGNDASASGGGMYNAGDPRSELGSVSLTGSMISRNQAGARGGGIYSNAGKVSAAATRIVGNTAVVGGGGIGDFGTITITLTGSPVIGNKPDNCEPPSSVTGCDG